MSVTPVQPAEAVGQNEMSLSIGDTHVLDCPQAKGRFLGWNPSQNLHSEFRPNCHTLRSGYTVYRQLIWTQQRPIQRHHCRPRMTLPSSKLAFAVTPLNAKLQTDGRTDRQRTVAVAQFALRARRGTNN